jgi:CHAT domain-containing protein
LDLEDFAQLVSDRDTRLVILSSCEGTSGLAISRMASWGVPAVVGFRWPVDDGDACLFTIAFHAQLHEGGVNRPVSIAFHKALLTLKKYAPMRLTGFSPVLMIQRSTWHDFALEG